MFRYLLVIIPLLLLGTASLWLDQESQPQVHFAPEGEGNRVYAAGRVEGAQPDVELRFEMPGRISTVYVREGDRVQAGDRLMQLDPAALRHQVDLREAELKLAEAQLDRIRNGAHEHERLEARSQWEAKKAELKRAQLNWERVLELRQNAAITQQEADHTRGELDRIASEVSATRARCQLLAAPARADELAAAEARCLIAKASLELARTQLQKTELCAPCAGQIVSIDPQAGELSGPDVPLPAVVLVDTSAIRVRAFVEEQDVPRVQIGQAVTIKVEGQSQLAGRVVELSPRMSRKQAWSDLPDERYDLKTREVLIEVVEPVDLIPGLFVDVEIAASDD